MFDYLEQYEADTGEEIKLDVIALCCEFSEDSPENIADQYGIEGDEAEVIATLEENGAFVGKTDSGAIVYRSY